MVIHAGRGSGRSTITLYRSSEYVALDDCALDTADELWEQLKQTLLETAAQRRMSKPQIGRPAKGPGSALGDEAADRIAAVREKYNEITRRKQRPAQYAEVAAALQPPISATTLWRMRRTYGMGWPP